jgi:hypothetical protein
VSAAPFSATCEGVLRIWGALNFSRVTGNCVSDGARPARLPSAGGIAILKQTARIEKISEGKLILYTNGQNAFK